MDNENTVNRPIDIIRSKIRKGMSLVDAIDHAMKGNKEKPKKKKKKTFPL